MLRVVVRRGKEKGRAKTEKNANGSKNSSGTDSVTKKYGRNVKKNKCMVVLLRTVGTDLTETKACLIRLEAQDYSEMGK